ncbi:MAG: hypothetical protein K1X89_17420 [Myxococcaceae bacterium]|nr:hypothetical protein [Myxococcaceae bacterium]
MRLAFVSAVALATGCAHYAIELDPSMGQAEVPAGKVDVNAVADDDVPWSVYGTGQPPCQTPCPLRLDATRGLTFESPRGFTVSLSTLGEAAIRTRRALVVAQPPSEAKRVNGIVFTSLGGMGLVAGIALSAVGCSNVQARGGICTAGLITGGVTGLLTAAAIFLLLDSGPQADVVPIALEAR